MRYSGHFLPGGGPRTVPGLSGVIISLGWLGYVWCPSRMSWRKLLGRRKSGLLCRLLSPWPKPGLVAKINDCIDGWKQIRTSHLCIGNSYLLFISRNSWFLNTTMQLLSMCTSMGNIKSKRIQYNFIHITNFYTCVEKHINFIKSETARGQAG